MHFGKIVKSVAYSRELSAEDLAGMLRRTEAEVLSMYEQEEWTSGNIRAASVVLEHDFGKYLNNHFGFDFGSEETEYKEFLITVKYPAGKEFLLKTWLKKIALIAKYIGLEAGR